MKKIAFSDKYGLTQAVLEGRKTMTRRLIKPDYETVSCLNVNYEVYRLGELDGETFDIIPRYEVGQVVAIAQRYESVYNHYRQHSESVAEEFKRQTENSFGWKNKKCVKAELMPFRIKIVDVRIQRLREITDIDCMKEGVKEVQHPFVKNANNVYICQGINGYYKHPKDCFSDLIDKVSGGGTWDSNPWVFVYEFQLLK